MYIGLQGLGVATSREVQGSIPGGVTGDFFRGSPRRSHVPWGRLSPRKLVPGISPGVKAAGVWLATYHPRSAERQENPGP